MGKILVIVESPTKAKKLTEYLKGLPDQYVVQSSVGHIRDLPSSSAEIPAKVKKEPWARVGINVEEDFAPLYVVRGDSRKRINELKALLKEVDLLLLATDEDREGEAISWHLLEVLKPQVPVKRMVFHEITKTKIREALAETRELDDSLVEAQETRRIVETELNLSKSEFVSVMRLVESQLTVSLPRLLRAGEAALKDEKPRRG